MNFAATWVGETYGGTPLGFRVWVGVYPGVGPLALINPGLKDGSPLGIGRGREGRCLLEAVGNEVENHGRVIKCSHSFINWRFKNISGVSKLRCKRQEKL